MDQLAFRLRPAIVPSVMNPLPLRAARPLLVLEELRACIARGELRGQLPPERQLSETFGVARGTLRLALEQLKSEGLVTVRAKRTFVSEVPHHTKHQPLAKQRVLWLSGFTLEEFAVDGLTLFVELSGRLNRISANLQYVTLPSPPPGPDKVRAFIRRLQNRWNPSAWVLHRAGAALEEFFSGSGLPVFRYGNPMIGGRLPSLFVDFEGCTRHSLHTLYRLGHEPSRILCITGDAAAYATRQVRTAFTTTAAPNGLMPPAGNILAWKAHPGAAGFTREIAAVMARRPAPTAIVILQSANCIRLHSVLAHKLGLRIPDDVSIVCLTDNPAFQSLIPEPARYRFHYSKAVANMFNSLARQLQNAPASEWQHAPLVPEPIQGQTLSPPPPPEAA